MAQLLSKRRGEKRAHDDYLYVAAGLQRGGEEKVWRCEKKNTCNARMYTATATGEFLRVVNEHSHPANPEKVEAEKVSSAIRRLSATPTILANIITRPDSTADKILMLQAMVRRKEIVLGSLSPTVTLKDKEQAWKEIKAELDAANAVTLASKSWKILRDQYWADMRRRTMAKCARIENSGGDFEEQLSELDKLVLQLLMKDQPAANQDCDGIAATDGMQLVKDEPFVYDQNGYNDVDGSAEPSSSSHAVHDFVPSTLVGTMENCLQPLSGFASSNDVSEHFHDPRKRHTSSLEELQRAYYSQQLEIGELKKRKLQLEIAALESQAQRNGH